MGKVKEYIGEEENFSFNSFQTIDELIDFLTKAKSLGATNIHFDFDESDGNMCPYFEREETEEEINKPKMPISSFFSFISDNQNCLSLDTIRDAQTISFMNLISKNKDHETTI